MFGSSAAAKTFTSLILHFKVINSSGCHNGNQEFKCLGNDGVASSRLVVPRLRNITSCEART
jgi:hypothetical protein